MSGGGPVAATSTHAQRPAKPVSSPSYQRGRVNVFIPHPQRQQLDALAGEWNCPLVETVRRVLDRGLRGVMQADTESGPALQLDASREIVHFPDSFPGDARLPINQTTNSISSERKMTNDQ
jgi:hypothetical protein